MLAGDVSMKKEVPALSPLLPQQLLSQAHPQAPLSAKDGTSAELAEPVLYLGGTLLKQTPKLRQWVTRSFVVDKKRMVLTYGKKEKEVPIGEIVSIDHIEEEDSTFHQFEIKTSKIKIRVAASTKGKREYWVSGLLDMRDYIQRQEEEKMFQTITEESIESGSIVNLLPGEVVKVKINEQKNNCYISNYAIHLIPMDTKRKTEEDFSPSSSGNPSSSPTCNNLGITNTSVSITIPLTCIHKVEKSDGEGGYCVDMLLRDLREIRLVWTLNDQRAKFLQCLNFYLPKSFDKMFAFVHQAPLPDDSLLDANFRTYGYVHYNPEEEFHRIVKNSQWKIVNTNDKYQLCPTYPAILWVPSDLREDALIEIARFRTKGRLPALSWLHPITLACLLRSSQPRRGMTGNNVEDQEYLDLLGTFGNQTGRKLYVMDARAKVAAMANKAKGAGFEDDYENSKVVFLNIDNIHGVRASWKALIQLCSKNYNCTDNIDINWHTKVGETGWLFHIYRIMRGAILTVEKLSEGYSVLVHCSDGWDRTVQIVSLTMLLCDPHYRTITGFQKLIEKEWLSFGHQFHTRHGLSGTTSEEAPIFLQFLESVCNFIKLYPTAFQFNENFLISIFDGSYSGAFCTFMFNCERERRKVTIWEKGPSLWHHLENNLDLFINPFYQKIDKVLCPKHFQMKHLTVWEKLFFRWDLMYMAARCFIDDKVYQQQLASQLEGKEEDPTPLQPASPSQPHPSSPTQDGENTELLEEEQRAGYERDINDLKSDGPNLNKNDIKSNNPEPPELLEGGGDQSPQKNYRSFQRTQRAATDHTTTGINKRLPLNIPRAPLLLSEAISQPPTRLPPPAPSKFPPKPTENPPVPHIVVPSQAINPNRRRGVPVTKKSSETASVSANRRDEPLRSYGMTVIQLKELRASLRAMMKEPVAPEFQDRPGDDDEANNDETVL